MNEQRCGTCRHFQEAGFAGSGWCHHPQRRTTSDLMIMVRKQEIACRDAWSNSLWEPAAGGKAEGQATGQQATFVAQRLAPASEREIAALMPAAPAPIPASSAEEKPTAKANPPVEDVVLSEARVVSTHEADWQSPRIDTSSSQEYDTRDAIKKAREAYRGRIKPDKARWLVPPIAGNAAAPELAPARDEPNVPRPTAPSPSVPRRFVAIDPPLTVAVAAPTDGPTLVGLDDAREGEPEDDVADEASAWPFEDAFDVDNEPELEPEPEPEPEREPAHRSFWRGGRRRRPDTNLGRFASLRWGVDHDAAVVVDLDDDREGAAGDFEADDGGWHDEPDHALAAEREAATAEAEAEADQSSYALPPPIALLPTGPELSPELPRVCRTCRDFRPAEGGDRGWCANQWAFTHRRVVGAADQTPCEASFGNWWLPVDDVWADEADVSAHGMPTPLLDGWMPHAEERQPQRRRS